MAVASGSLTAGAPISLVTANPGTNTIDLLQGFGGGAVANPAVLIDTINAGVVRGGDFNDDGSLDLALLSDRGVSVLLGDGRGGFLSPVNHDAGLEPAGLTIADASYTILQLPFNAAQQTFAGCIARAAARGMRVAINRPFAMGRILYENRELTKPAAFAFILGSRFDGVILSGTKSTEHLDENWRAFQDAVGGKI